MSITTTPRTGAGGARPGHDDGAPEHPRPRRGRGRRRGRRRAITVTLLALTVVLALPLAGGLFLAHQFNSNITRLGGLFPPAEGRPAHPRTGPGADALNILLLGTDRRSDVPTTGSAAGASAWVAGEQRSDTMMVLHIDGDRQGASAISIPRDSWVDVPGHGPAKVNAAFSWGGPALAVATVEKLTGVRIDHVAIVDWDGYAAMVDALGGVDVTVPRTVYDHYRDQTWIAGRHHLAGAAALRYVGQRAGLPGGDLDRVKRQQAVLRALSAKAAGATSSPAAAYRLLETLSRHLTVDAGWGQTDMARLLLSLRGLGPSDVAYTTIPVTGTGRVGDQSVVFVDPARSARLWQAVRDDAVAGWAEAHPGRLTSGTVR